MINRRTLLLGTAAAALSGLAASCQRAGTSALKVVLLEGAIPAEVLQTFKKQSEYVVGFQAKPQIADIFQQLQIWKEDSQKDASGDKVSGIWESIKRWSPWAKDEAEDGSERLVSLGDYWLESAITQELIEPLEVPADSLEKLPIAWQQFAQRDSRGLVEGLAAGLSAAQEDSQNEAAPEADLPKISLWAAPYKMQALVVVYRQSGFPQDAGTSLFSSWQSLLQPELKQSITLPDHPRLAIALANKIQAGRFNAVIEGAGNTIRIPVTEETSPADNSASEQPLLTAGLDSELMGVFMRLNEQVKTYSSQNPLKALVNEDVKAVVCWSGDAIAATKRYRDLRIALPEEGSLLSADMWVRPKGAEMSQAAQQWIDFCWQVGPATQISVSGKGLSPTFLQGEATLPKALEGGLLSTAVMQNSEPLLPIPAALKTAYIEMWKQLRSAPANA